MSKIFINATKNFGEKINNAIENNSERIDGIYYSIADVPKNKTELFDFESVYKFPEFPLFYLTKKNEYIDNFFDRSSITLEDNKEFIPRALNNKLICMEEHVDFSFMEGLPITTIAYSTKREDFMEMICDFYDEYYPSEYLMTPTFMIEKIGSWEEIMIADILKTTQEYIDKVSKDKVILSVLLKPGLLNNINIIENIKTYLELCPSINVFSLTIINDNTPYYYSTDDYKNIFSLLKDLRSMNLEVFIQYSGIKDVVFSVLDINRFSVGWFGSYRNFNTILKGIGEVSSDTFARRVKKILNENFMSEIPLDYLLVLTDEECHAYFGIDKEEIENIGFVQLEQIYWEEILKVIAKDSSLERGYQDEELIYERCTVLLNKLEKAIENLKFLIDKLELGGRFDDALKIKKNNVEYVKLYCSVLKEFRDTLFF